MTNNINQETGLSQNKKCCENEQYSDNTENSQYKKLFDTMTSAFSYHRMVYDETEKPIDYIFLDANFAFEKKLGFKREDFIGKSFSEVFTGADTEWLRICDKPASTSEPANVEYSLPWLGGKYYARIYSPQKGYFAVLYDIIPDGSKNNAESSCLNEDRDLYDYENRAGFNQDNSYSEEKDFENKKELEESKQQLEKTIHMMEEEIAYRMRVESDLANRNLLLNTLLDNICVGVSMIEAPTGKELFANKKAAELLGRDNLPDASNGSLAEQFQVYRLDSDELYPDGEMPIIRALNGESSWVDDMVVVHPDGKRKVLEVFGTPVRDIDGKIVASLVSFMDITQRKNSEFEIKELNNQLMDTNKKLKELNYELEEANNHLVEEISEHKRIQEELEKAKKLVEEANYSKSRFLSSMSREIRAPLNGIIGMTDLLLEDLENEQREMLEVVKSSSVALLRIINDVLDLSNIEVKKAELEPAEFDLRKTISDLNNSMQVLIFNKRLNYTCEIDSNIPPTVIGDEKRIRQILVNLIGNAIKFTFVGSIGLYIRVSKFTKDKVQLIFTVRDTGIGIKKEDIPKLFTYFIQLEDDMASRYQGAGLGLAISKRLVEIMDGEIIVESEPYVGSAFVFTILLGLTENKTAFTDEFRVEEISEASLGIADKNILLVEDDILSQLVLTKFCERNGWEYGIANNGFEALEMYKSCNYDIVLMDIQMPCINGFDTTAQLREIEKETGKKAIIIATTAYATPEDREKCLEVGMDDYMQKPIDLDQLLRKINSL